MRHFVLAACLAAWPAASAAQLAQPEPDSGWEGKAAVSARRTLAAGNGLAMLHDLIPPAGMIAAVTGLLYAPVRFFLEPDNYITGQVLAMRPLLWHASARANETAHRRVVHLEFCPCTLPGGLKIRRRAADIHRQLRKEQGGNSIQPHRVMDFLSVYAMAVNEENERMALESEIAMLEDAWREAGLPKEKVATLCRIAGAVDEGLFEGAGFKLENRTWTPGAKGCCFLRILRG